MLLITPTLEKLYLDELPFVTSTNCSYFSHEITIHLRCLKGNEHKLYNNLPKWIHELMEVTIDNQNISLKSKK